VQGKGTCSELLLGPPFWPFIGSWHQPSLLAELPPVPLSLYSLSPPHLVFPNPLTLLHIHAGQNISFDTKGAKKIIFLQK
jgi:hypothetical protein